MCKLVVSGWTLVHVRFLGLVLALEGIVGRFAWMRESGEAQEGEGLAPCSSLFDAAYLE